MEIIIFEDEYMFHNRLVAMIQSHKERHGEASVLGRIQVVEHNHMAVLEELELKPMKERLYIIDVDLKKSYNGFDLAKRIRQHDYESEIVFITSHIELMNNVFLLNLKVLNYIYKLDPILEERVKSVLEVVQENQIKKKHLIENDEHKTTYIYITSREGHKKINVDEIIALETDTLKRKVCMKTLKEEIEVRKSLKELLEELPNNFVKSHRSIVLNLAFVKEISIKDGYYQAVMMDGQRYDISRNYVKTLTLAFSNGQ